jgi:hypothetical protein
MISEAAMDRTPGTDAGLVQYIPPAAGAEYEEAIHGFPSIDAGTMASQRVQFARWEHGHDALPQLVRDTTRHSGLSRGHQASARLLQDRMLLYRIRGQGHNGIVS